MQCFSLKLWMRSDVSALSDVGWLSRPPRKGRGRGDARRSGYLVSLKVVTGMWEVRTWPCPVKVQIRNEFPCSCVYRHITNRRQVWWAGGHVAAVWHGWCLGGAWWLSPRPSDPHPLHHRKKAPCDVPKVHLAHTHPCRGARTYALPGGRPEAACQWSDLLNVALGVFLYTHGSEERLEKGAVIFLTNAMTWKKSHYVKEILVSLL